MIKITFKNFSGDEFKLAELKVRAALNKPNGALEFQDGILAADEEGLAAVISGSDEELGDGNKKCALVDAVYEQVSIIATSERAAMCKMEKGRTSRSRGPSK